VDVDSIGAWHRSNGNSSSSQVQLQQQRQQQQPQAVGQALHGGSHASSTACIPDLISLDSETVDLAVGAKQAGRS
jgi:hypothetical protein